MSIFREAGRTFLVKILGYFLGFLNSFIFARILGPSDFGVYSIANTIISFVTIFSLMGLNSGIIRFVGEWYGKDDFNKVSSFYSESIKISVFISIIASFLFYILRVPISNVFEFENLEYIIIIAFAIPFMTIFQVNGGLLRGVKKPSVFFFYEEILLRIVKLVIFFVLIYFLNPLNSLFAAMFLAILFVFLFSSFRVFKLIPNLKFIFKSNKKDSKELFKYSSYLMFVRFTEFMMGYVNTIIIGVFLNSESAGIYSISQILSGVLIFIYVSFNSIFVSNVADLFNNNKRLELEKLYSDITKIIIFLSLPLVIMMIVYSKSVLNIFGEEYVIGFKTLIILSLAQFVSISVGPNESLLSMSGNQKYSLINGIVIAVLNIVLNILLIPRYGIIGSAIGAGVSLIIVNILKYLEVYFILKINPYNKSYLKLFPISLIIFFFNFYIDRNFSTNLLYLIILGFVNYGILFLVYFLFSTKDEKNIIRKYFKK
ncbi:flippase [Oceanotoga sp. DSM 15011]|uniref:flippase n=1 Tax=Oceanotoga sp. DSM 15011 TaxID=2984951 RepID=UPI0021F49117|nr:flippase [Oceanotoga sp. DSM 15011]UYO99178.1 flippase [Oceanotoga sp. DSM 15011]